ncbi:pilus assembly protein [Pseudonocardia petroleophila]|uniref:Pilus assembly protein n=1 Tax=Pseudonocardia petroleophila TaxID=37331 RepID=A0A7G7MBN2_9PSEU|nr:TadE/TadG family type IV pilus assembly protein [Pseudonocardia petroleophila]QNG50193.1 pilus assembly protein [Pseudonocardia petroleophila]
MIARGERGGGPSVEAALLATLMGLLIGFVIAVGRLVAAESACDQAARAAARIASIERDAAQAQVQGQMAAESAVASQGLTLAQLAVTIDTSQLSRPLGEPGVVRADVACQVRWSDLAVPGAPGFHDLEASFTSPIDQFRERQR